MPAGPTCGLVGLTEGAYTILILLHSQAEFSSSRFKNLIDAILDGGNTKRIK